MDNIRIVVSIDRDDITTVDNYHNIVSIHDNIECVIGEPNGKIDAINRDVPDPKEFDILLLASDDMIPMVQGYDDIIRNKMKLYYPDTDGVLFFNDGYAEGTLNTLVICILCLMNSNSRDLCLKVRDSNTKEVDYRDFVPNEF